MHTWIHVEVIVVYIHAQHGRWSLNIYSIRQHTSAYVSMRPHASADAADATRATRQVEFKYIPQDITPRNRVLLARPAPPLPTSITISNLWPSASASGLGSLWKMWEGNGLIFSFTHTHTHTHTRIHTHTHTHTHTHR